MNPFDYTHAQFDHEMSMWRFGEVWTVSFLLRFHVSLLVCRAFSFPNPIPPPPPPTRSTRSLPPSTAAAVDSSKGDSGRLVLAAIADTRQGRERTRRRISATIVELVEKKG